MRQDECYSPEPHQYTAIFLLDFDWVFTQIARFNMLLGREALSVDATAVYKTVCVSSHEYFVSSIWVASIHFLVFITYVCTRTLWFIWDI